jgi:hypothetical protein
MMPADPRLVALTFAPVDAPNQATWHARGLPRPAHPRLLAGDRLLGAIVRGRAQRGGDERRARDHEAEREQTTDDPNRAGANRLAEDKDAPTIAERLAATEVIAITSIARPICRLRADA